MGDHVAKSVPTNIFAKFAGDRAKLPPRASPGAIGLAAIGGFLAIGAVAGLADLTATPLVLGSFGASCVLVFGYPDVPFSQPRNVVFGHVLSSLVGLLCLTVLGPHWWVAALAAGGAIALMMLTRTVHPPAGSNPVIVFLSHSSWGFLIFPTLVGAIVIALIALIYNNSTRASRYPKYW